MIDGVSEDCPQQTNSAGGDAPAASHFRDSTWSGLLVARGLTGRDGVHELFRIPFSHGSHWKVAKQRDDVTFDPPAVGRQREWLLRPATAHQ
jgi:hypothetical protein